MANERWHQQLYEKISGMNHKLLCQSCGMPLAQIEDFGTDADGSINSDYCAHCYQNGSFTNPFMTLVEMQDHVKQILQRQHEDYAKVNLVVTSLTELKRWARPERY